jgi:hypothetical protein
MGPPLTRYICRGYALRILHLLSSLEPDLQNSIATSYLLSLASLNSQIDIKKSYFLGAGYVHWLDSGGTWPVRTGLLLPIISQFQILDPPQKKN